MRGNAQVAEELANILLSTETLIFRKCIYSFTYLLIYLFTYLFNHSVIHSFNLLKTKRNLLYIRKQSVPRSKHFLPRL